MTLNLRLEYQTAYGEELYVVIGTTKEKAYPMSYISDGLWSANIKLNTEQELAYRYEVRYGTTTIRREWGAKHVIALDKKATNVRIADRWADMPSDRSFHSSMFSSFMQVRTRRFASSAS